MRKTALLLMILFIVKIQAQNYLISFAGTGEVTTVDIVKVENLTKCTSLTLTGNDILHLSSTVGINETNDFKNNLLHAYPNPMTDYCLIEFEANAQGEATLGLFDITGKRITQVHEFLAKGHHAFKLTGISSGIFVFKAESEHYSYTTKIISNSPISGIAELTKMTEESSVKTQENVPDKGIEKSLKGNKSTIEMKYNTGDILKFTGISGNYSTAYMLVATQNQTVTFNFIACTDGDNNNYTIVQIGTQTWMEENLKTTKYYDGNPIPLVTDTIAWINSTGSPAYCWYNNNIGYKNSYGALYNWYAVNTGKLCPSGWHVFTRDEWNILNTYLGGASVAGGKMKEVCAAHWASPNTGADNSSGLTVLPDGNRRYSDGFFYSMGSIALFWSSTMYDASSVYDFGLSSISSSSTEYHTGSLTNGFSVRCVK